MNKLLGYGFVVAVVFFAARGAMQYVSDLQLQNEVAAVPGSTAVRMNTAAGIATLMRDTVNKNGCVSIDDSVEVDLAQPEVRGTPPMVTTWQWVTMRITCVRPNLFFQKKPHTVIVKMEMMALGGAQADHYPSEADRPPPRLKLDP